MRTTKRLAVLLSVAVLSGCATLMTQSPVEYQENHSVVAGQIVNEEKGTYHLTFPHENYYLERSPYRLAFVPKAQWKIMLGSYAIKVVPQTYLAKDHRQDLEKVFKLFMRKELGRKALRKAIMFKQEERDFRGNKALYKEFFIPEAITKNFDGDKVKIPAFSYAAIVFMYESNVFWLIHGEPVDELVLEGKKIEPRVEPKTVERMQAFLDSLVFGSSK